MKLVHLIVFTLPSNSSTQRVESQGSSAHVVVRSTIQRWSRSCWNTPHRRFTGLVFPWDSSDLIHSFVLTAYVPQLPRSSDFHTCTSVVSLRGNTDSWKVHPRPPPCLTPVPARHQTKTPDRTTLERIHYSVHGVLGLAKPEFRIAATDRIGASLPFQLGQTLFRATHEVVPASLERVSHALRSDVEEDQVDRAIPE